MNGQRCCKATAIKRRFEQMVQNPIVAGRLVRNGSCRKMLSISSVAPKHFVGLGDTTGRPDLTRVSRVWGSAFQ